MDQKKWFLSELDFVKTIESDLRKDVNISEIYKKLEKKYNTKDSDVILIYLAKNIYMRSDLLREFVNYGNSIGIFSPPGNILLLLSQYISGIGDSYSKSSQYNIIATKILRAFDIDKLSKEQMDQLILITKDTKEYDMVYDFIRNKYGQDEVASKPKWVSKEEGEDLSLLEKVSVGKNSEDMRVYFDTVSKMFDLNIEDEENRELDEETLNLIKEKNEDKENAFMAYLSGVSEGEIVKEKEDEARREFRVWGPINRGNYDCSFAPGGEGPCRMMYCNCREGIEGEDYNEDIDWFHGKCDVCKKSITNRSHAIREPKVGGGWQGCYCSEECMTKEREIEDKKADILIRNALRSLNEYGIMDRSI